jgi:clathrin heavy chain
LLRAYVSEPTFQQGSCLLRRGGPDGENCTLLEESRQYFPSHGAITACHENDPDKGTEFATQLANDESGPLVDVERVVNTLLQKISQPASSFLLDTLKANKQEQGHLQTRLLEMNLIHAPQVSDAILGNEMFTHHL